jgi:hypothetical protein
MTGHAIRGSGFNKATVKAGEVAIKAAMLMNGGAVVSVLHLHWRPGPKGRPLTVKQIGDVSGSLLWFASGRLPRSRI